MYKFLGPPDGDVASCGSYKESDSTGSGCISGGSLGSFNEIDDTDANYIPCGNCSSNCDCSDNCSSNEVDNCSSNEVNHSPCTYNADLVLLREKIEEVKLLPLTGNFLKYFCSSETFSHYF